MISIYPQLQKHRIAASILHLDDLSPPVITSLAVPSPSRHVALLVAGPTGHLAETASRAAHPGHAVLGPVAGADAPRS